MRNPTSTGLVLLRTADLETVADCGPRPAHAGCTPVGCLPGHESHDPTELVEHLSQWTRDRVDADLEVLLADLATLNSGNADNESLRCLAAADWFMRRFAPEMLDHVGQSTYAAVLRNLPEVCDAGTVDRAVSVCSSLTYLVNDEADEVFRLAIDALEFLQDESPDVASGTDAQIRTFPGAFGRRLADAVLAAAATLGGGQGPDGDGTRAGVPDAYEHAEQNATVVSMVVA